MSILSRLVDERFLAHRRHSTSLAGMFSAALALVLFEWRLWVHHVLNWDLLAVGLTFVVIKFAVLGWHLLKD
jgi:hypothetical protein